MSLRYHAPSHTICIAYNPDDLTAPGVFKCIGEDVAPQEAWDHDGGLKLSNEQLDQCTITSRESDRQKLLRSLRNTKSNVAFLVQRCTPYNEASFTEAAQQLCDRAAEKDIRVND